MRVETRSKDRSAKAKNAPDLVEQGTVRGHDVFGRAVVDTDQGATRRLNWGRVELLPKDAFGSLQRTNGNFDVLVEGLPPGAVSEPPGKLVDASRKSGERVVFRKHTVEDFLGAIEGREHDLLDVGGAPRDSLYLLGQNAKASAEELVANFSDRDVVTTALPSEVRAAAQRVAPGPDTFWTQPSDDRFGVVGIGSRKEGLDVATLRVGAAGREGATFGKHIETDALGRDFSVNGIYLHRGTGLLIDSTGHGVEDAQAHVLRVNEHEMEKNEVLSLRYIKFRAKGFDATDRTRDLMREHALAVWPQLVARGRFVNQFLRIVPATCVNRETLNTYFDKLERLMKDDGFELLFNEFIRPSKDAIAAELARRQAMSAAKAG